MSFFFTSFLGNTGTQWFVSHSLRLFVHFIACFWWTENKFGIENVKAIADMLSQSSSIRTLNISSSFKSFILLLLSCFQNVIFKMMEYVLLEQPWKVIHRWHISIYHLIFKHVFVLSIIPNNQIGVNGARAFRDALKTTPSLEYVSFGCLFPLWIHPPFSFTCLYDTQTVVLMMIQWNTLLKEFHRTKHSQE